MHIQIAQSILAEHGYTSEVRTVGRATYLYASKNGREHTLLTFSQLVGMGVVRFRAMVETLDTLERAIEVEQRVLSNIQLLSVSVVETPPHPEWRIREVRRG